MDKLTEKKILEAKEHVEAAEKSLKTSLFKRKPDFDTAASEYNQAAICNKVAKQFDKAIEYFQKSSDCYLNLKSQFNAAKQLEQVAFISNELKKNDLTYQSISKAADLFLENGTRDTAGILLEKGANMLKQNDPEKSLLLYKRAIDVAEIEDKHHEMVALFEHSIPIAMKIKKYNEAMDLMHGCIEALYKIQSYDAISKHVVSIVVIHLSNDDWVSATKEMKTMREKYQFESSRIEDLIQVFDEKDSEAFNKLLKNYLSYAVDNEVLKVAQKITSVGQWDTIAKPAAVAKPLPTYKQANESPKHQQKYEEASQPAAVDTFNQLAESTRDMKLQDIPAKAASASFEEPEAEDKSTNAVESINKPNQNNQVDEEEEEELDLL